MTNDLHHLAAAYSLDALESEERRAFEAHYPTCEVCALEVLELRETAAQLAAAEATAPPPQLKERVMAEVGANRQLSPRLSGSVADLAERRRGRFVGPALLVAAAVAMVALATLGLLQAGDDPDDLGRLVAASDTVVTDLDGEAGRVRVLWSAERDQLAVVGDDLADPGPDRSYVLWFVDGSRLTAAGAFDGDDGPPQILDVEDIEAAAWGVTIESDPDTVRPTGDIILRATV